MVVVNTSRRETTYRTPEQDRDQRVEKHIKQATEGNNVSKLFLYYYSLNFLIDKYGVNDKIISSLAAKDLFSETSWSRLTSRPALDWYIQEKIYEIKIAKEHDGGTKTTIFDAFNDFYVLDTDDDLQITGENGESLSLPKYLAKNAGKDSFYSVADTSQLIHLNNLLKLVPTCPGKRYALEKSFYHSRYDNPTSIDEQATLLEKCGERIISTAMWINDVEDIEAANSRDRALTIFTALFWSAEVADTFLRKLEMKRISIKEVVELVKKEDARSNWMPLFGAKASGPIYWTILRDPDLLLDFLVQNKKKFGITHFSRYNLAILTNNLMPPDNIRHALVVTADGDWNGAFERGIDANIMELYENGYAVQVYEASNRRSFVNILQQKRASNEKPDLLIINGHGFANGINLGQNDIDKSLGWSLKNHNDIFASGARILLNSCSTGGGGTEGNNIASYLFKTLNNVEMLFAPSTFASFLMLSFDENERLESASWMTPYDEIGTENADVETVVFSREPAKVAVY